MRYAGDSNFKVTNGETGEIILEGFYDRAKLEAKDKYSVFLGGDYGHIKISDGEEKEKPSKEETGFRFRPVGHGIQNFNEILAAAEETGVEYVIVEQDDSYDTPSLETARLSRDYLKTLGI